MTGIQTATVETLTAEVHVLKVGSRQITLSVAKQLDDVPYEDMEPMGRVRINRYSNYLAYSKVVELIGRHRETGALVFSILRIFYGDEGCYYDEYGELDMNFEEAQKLPLIVLAGLK
jgi:hypothetical protein